MVKDFVDDDVVFKGEGVCAAESCGVWIEPASGAVRAATLEAIVDSCSVNESDLARCEKEQAFVVVGSEAESYGVNGREGSGSEVAGGEEVIVGKGIGSGDDHAAERDGKCSVVVEFQLETGRSGRAEFVEGDGGNKRLIIDCAGCAIEAGAVCPVLWVSAAGSRVDFCESGTRTIGAKWPRVGVTVGNFIHDATAIEGF